jgi:hypothetical protein
MNQIKIRSRVMGTVLMLALGFCRVSGASAVAEYRVKFGQAVDIGGSRCLITLRSFTWNGNPHLLLVDPADLATSAQPADRFRVTEMSWPQVEQKFGESAYVKAVVDDQSRAEPLQDAGITRFSKEKKGIDVTVDLCPSKKPLDRVLFKTLIRELGPEEKPVPVAIAVTGVWMKNHRGDLQWLRGLVRDGELSVTWINHSFSHRVGRNIPLNRNFLLETGTDIRSEILKTEIAMLENGLLPSIFFRFPGLVSNADLFHRVAGFGLIPIGSDAWLGKNMWPKEGSIVLVHANGNEPIGIKRFLELLRLERENIIRGQWLLLDLRESTIEQEVEK